MTTSRLCEKFEACQGYAANAGCSHALSIPNSDIFLDYCLTSQNPSSDDNSVHKHNLKFVNYLSIYHYQNIL
jgi:hypothetical protein